MIPYQVGRRISWQEHAKRKRELWEEQGGKCAECGLEFPASDDGARHHPQMVSAGGVDLPGIANECWICHNCHDAIHPWLATIV